ncbi:TfoX/Sxy family protein [Streptomyces sp. NPDC096339]|uniref:TfoX/Sxy family protein n=1 Tax=Streptomyces sp. NPDC096339 TaxID=3366086 RepID=UPI003810F7A8
MAYDEMLAERVREQMEPEGVVAKKMFGGITFLFQGNVLANVYEEGLMVRVGPDGMDEALARPGTRQLVCRGRAQKGWVVPAEEALDDDVLDQWLTWTLDVTAQLPPK